MSQWVFETQNDPVRSQVSCYSPGWPWMCTQTQGFVTYMHKKKRKNQTEITNHHVVLQLLPRMSQACQGGVGSNPTYDICSVTFLF